MSGCCNNDPIITSQKGERGEQGYNGWTALLANVTDGSRIVQRIIGWTGGTGSTPGYVNQYIGSAGIVADIADATDIRGATGATGSTGATGNNGWTAVLAAVTDGSRIVHQIVDWTGGGGTKPSVINQFIGAAGIVSSAASAVDIRGPQGPAGNDGSDASIPSQTGNNGKFLTTDGATASWEAIQQVPSLSGANKRILREASSGTAYEWYTTFSEFKSIPFQSTGIFSSTTSYVTLRNSGSSVFAKATLPNDSSTRRFYIICSINASSLSTDGNDSLVTFAFRDITANSDLQVNVVETAYRKSYTFIYVANIVCTGQEVGMQWKHAVGQNQGSLLGAYFAITEII